MTNKHTALPLTKGYSTVIDKEDYPLVAGFKWYATENHSGKVYAARNGIKDNGKYGLIYMHRVISGAERGQYVDHIDGDGLNNTKANMRLCSNSENLRNRGMPSNNSSGFKGVYWHKERCKWRAEIRVNGKPKHLGYFSDAEDAHKAYCDAGIELHGDYFNSGRVAELDNLENGS